jgi:hypothetical protein
VFSPVTEPIALPWTSGFEDAFCGYTEAKGFCYAHAGAAYSSVVSPVHSGKRAAAFSVHSEEVDGGMGTDTRCVREGTFPHDAYYGAWFYLPSLPQSTDNWNLVHFHGGNGNGWNNLWDVTLVKNSNGGFGLTVYSGRGLSLGPNSPPDVPIATWFHVVLRIVRAADTTGEVALYQDEQLLLDVPGIATDPYQYDQWYVGNLAYSSTPPDLTLYVDDVSVSASR